MGAYGYYTYHQKQQQDRPGEDGGCRLPPHVRGRLPDVGGQGPEVAHDVPSILHREHILPGRHGCLAPAERDDSEEVGRGLLSHEGGVREVAGLRFEPRRVGPVARAALAVAAGAARPEDRLASRGRGPRERKDVLADPGGVLQSGADRANPSRDGGGRRAVLDRLAQDGELALEIGGLLAQPFTLVSCVPEQEACLLELQRPHERATVPEGFAILLRDTAEQGEQPPYAGSIHLGSPR